MNKKIGTDIYTNTTCGVALPYLSLPLLKRVFLTWTLLICLYPQKGFSDFYSIDPAYMDPTDLASGGASTTFATNEGMVFSNPALLPVVPTTLRWLGTRISIMPTKGAIDAFSGDIPEFDPNDISTSLDAFSEVDVGVGAGSTLLTFIMSNFAIVPVGTDLRVALGFRKFGSLESGSPNYEAFLDLENKTGLAVAFALRPVNWWSFGVTGKGFLVTDQLVSIPLNISEFAADPDSATASINTAIEDAAKASPTQQVVGYDVGNLFFFQGSNIDLRLATVVRDVGGATISEGSLDGLVDVEAGETPAVVEETPKEKPQAIDVGVGLTLHTQSSFIHFAADIKDYQNAYNAPDFKRYALGVKAHFARWVALGAGVRHGYGTMGMEADLILFRLSASKYTNVLGDDPAGRKREFYHVSLAFGTDF